MEKNNLFSRLTLIALLMSNSAAILPMESDSTQESAAMECEETCSLCLCDGPTAEFRELGCGHRFCVTCLAQLLHLGLDEEWAQSMAQHLHCPKKGCEYQMDETDIQSISGNQARVARYHEVLTRLFFNANRNIRHCPTAACEVMYEPSFRPELITCRACEATYCSYCQHPHDPSEACRQAVPSIQNDNNATNANISAEELQERQYQDWLRANTKPCPQCKSNIQKNGGCNHMTCKNCNHQFCWKCLAHWRGLQDPGYQEFSRTHQGFYTCNAGIEQVQAPAISARLIEYAPRRQNEPQSLLYQAINNNNIDLIRLLLEHGVNPNLQDNARQQRPILIQAPAPNINQPQREAGHINPMFFGPPGVGNGRIAQLIGHGLNPNQPAPAPAGGPLPLLGNIFRQPQRPQVDGNDITHELIERHRPLFEAIRDNNIDLVRELLDEQGANANQPAPAPQGPAPQDPEPRQ